MAIRFPSPRLTLPPLVLLAFLSGCGQPSESRELRVLREANESLRQRLTDTEEALAQARAELERRDQSAGTSATEDATVPPVATTVPAGDSASPSPENNAVEDTTYIVVSKHHVPGQLEPRPTGADPGAARRTPPVYQVTFRGEQSARLYPPLNVTELAYPRFREGLSYARAVLNAAKVTAGGPATGSATGPADSGTLPPIDFDSIFGTR
ncbi:MAG: hypothetical protein ABII82_07855 [Verrucomicrobiota bacterium]